MEERKGGNKEKIVTLYMKYAQNFFKDSNINRKMIYFNQFAVARPEPAKRFIYLLFSYATREIVSFSIIIFNNWYSFLLYIFIILLFENG